jgi:hypothetical protein
MLMADQTAMYDVHDAILLAAATHATIGTATAMELAHQSHQNGMPAMQRCSAASQVCDEHGLCHVC